MFSIMFNILDPWPLGEVLPNPIWRYPADNKTACIAASR
jgi:hypothetical protein